MELRDRLRYGEGAFWILNKLVELGMTLTNQQDHVESARKIKEKKKKRNILNTHGFLGWRHDCRLSCV